MSKLGIVSLQRKPPDVFSWIRYHRDVGITYFYIWLEDSDDLGGSKYETLMVNDKELVQTAV